MYYLYSVFSHLETFNSVLKWHQRVCTMTLLLYNCCNWLITACGSKYRHPFTMFYSSVTPKPIVLIHVFQVYMGRWDKSLKKVDWYQNQFHRGSAEKKKIYGGACNNPLAKTCYNNSLVRRNYKINITMLKKKCCDVPLKVYFSHNPCKL